MELPFPPAPKDMHQSRKCRLVEGCGENTQAHMHTQTRTLGHVLSWPKGPVGKHTSDKIWHQIRYKEQPVWGLRVLPDKPMLLVRTHIHPAHTDTRTHSKTEFLLSNTAQLQTTGKSGSMLVGKPDEKHVFRRQKTSCFHCLPFFHLSLFHS